MSSQISNPIFALAREHADEEIVVHGAAVVKIQNQELIGHKSFSFLARSLLSPWQFLANELSYDEDFWCIGMSLHSGQEQHMQALNKLSDLAVAGENELFCPRYYPLDWEHAARLRFAKQKPLRIHHPCSGKHLMYLAACEQKGFSKENYWDPSHPLQKKLFAYIGNEVREQIKWTYDSCGLPTFLLSARQLMSMSEKLVLDEKESTVFLLNMYLRNPLLIGGFGRLDTELSKASKGSMIVKEGADGLLMLQSLPYENEPAASCLIKVASGYNKDHLALALLTTIKKYPQLPSSFHHLADHLNSRIDEWIPAGQKLVGLL